MAVATSHEPGRLTLADLSPALRKAAEARPLLPWIDLTQAIPHSPILGLLEEFGSCEFRRPRRSRTTDPLRKCGAAAILALLHAGGFFDADDVLAPRVQWGIWVLRRRGYALGTIHNYILHLSWFTAWLSQRGHIKIDPMITADFWGWSKGELPDLGRLPAQDWECLYLYESAGQKTYGSLDQIRLKLQLPASTDSEKRHMRKLIHKSIRRARIIRDNPSGVLLSKPPRPSHSLDNCAGSKEARDELVYFWWRQHYHSAPRRKRWKDFPTKVRKWIGGEHFQLIKDWPASGRKASGFQQSCISAAKKRLEKRACPGRGSCSLAVEFARRSARETPADSLEWFESLDSAARSSICAKHTRTPKSVGAVKTMIKRAKRQQRNRWRKGNRSQRKTFRRNRIFYRLAKRGWSDADIAKWWNSLRNVIREKISPEWPWKVSEACVRVAIRIYASDMELPLPWQAKATPANLADKKPKGGDRRDGQDRPAAEPEAPIEPAADVDQVPETPPAADLAAKSPLDTECQAALGYFGKDQSVLAELSQAQKAQLVALRLRTDTPAGEEQMTMPNIRNWFEDKIPPREYKVPRGRSGKDRIRDVLKQAERLITKL